MPIYEYSCFKGHITEDLKSYDDQSTPPCEVCGDKTSKIVSLFARTPGFFGDNGIIGSSGVNGFYDRGLGRSYSSWSERSKIMKEKGLQDWDDGAFEKSISEEKSRIAKQEKYLKTYEEVATKVNPIDAMIIAKEESEK